ncbi:butyrophilin subfamily 3 member A1-like [Chiloscyllium plagiosum]|uniref:butyrophilin subfamily 3 member A1-like n=1 Tax=Chiloscyllium plagiosum TaxID=36176 RepID=UPI001CB80CD9|nr:butyrophilin subfamily 3 member A1-like [Chiloscyllium plagiosum]
MNPVRVTVKKVEEGSPFNRTFFLKRILLDCCGFQAADIRTDLRGQGNKPKQCDLGQTTSVTALTVSLCQLRLVFGLFQEEVSRRRRISDELGHDLSRTDSVLSTEKSNMLLPFTVWTEIVEAIKLNKVSVTLDVETANPWLEIFENLKSLRRTETRRNLPNTGKRFTTRLCALGSQGFTSGRHYWEVDVGGNQCWGLGVASESVQRKDWVSVIPGNGFWTMERSGNQFYINSSPRSPLPVGQIPRKVGVYLSYECGTVSFCNADTKSHLHTFTGNKFTEKLYPFFGTWDLNQFLRISC